MHVYVLMNVPLDACYQFVRVCVLLFINKIQLKQFLPCVFIDFALIYDCRGYLYWHGNPHPFYL